MTCVPVDQTITEPSTDSAGAGSRRRWPDGDRHHGDDLRERSTGRATAVERDQLDRVRRLDRHRVGDDAAIAADAGVQRSRASGTAVVTWRAVRVADHHPAGRGVGAGVVESKTTTSRRRTLAATCSGCRAGQATSAGGTDTISTVADATGSAWPGSLRAANVPTMARAAAMAPQRVHPVRSEEVAPSG